MRNVSDKISLEIQNTHFMFNNFLFLKNPAVCEIMLKNIAQPDVSHMAIWRMRIACWIPKAKDTLSEHVIPIAFTLQKWLHERALRLCYIHCLSCLKLRKSEIA